MPLVLLKLGVDESFSLFDNQEKRVFDFFGVFFYRTEYLSTSPLFGEKKCPHLPSLNNQKMFERPSFHLMSPRCVINSSHLLEAGDIYTLIKWPPN